MLSFITIILEGVDIMKQTVLMKSGTSKVKCDGLNCISEFQDKTYGKNIRLHNYTKAGKLRCTVCEKEKGV